MNSLTNILVLTACSALLVESMPPSPTSNRPPYVECLSSEECSFDSCCVLGMGRYSIPMCLKKLQLNDNCRPSSNEPVNSTVTYLDGQVVSLYNVHMIMCPCADGLTCDHKIGKCVEIDGSPFFNHLYEQHPAMQD